MCAVAVGTAAGCGSKSGARATGGPVTYAGDAVLRTGADLGVRLGIHEDVAAVTYSLDGKPIGASTADPFSTRVGDLAVGPGRHTLRATAVTVSNRRYRSRPYRVTVAQPASRVIVASPTHGWRAARQALARGGAVVRLLPGVYPASRLLLRDHTTLLADRGAILQAPAGSYDSALVVWGNGITVDGPTIDGAGAGHGDGQAIAVRASTDVVIRNVRIRRARGFGIYMWDRLRNVSVQDSRITSAGTAAAGVSVEARDGNDVSVIRTRIAGFRGWGINFVQTRYDLDDSGLRNVALDNYVTDIDERAHTDGRSKGGIWSGGPQARIIGNRVSRIGWDGIETVGSSVGDYIVGNAISNTRTGIYLEHATHKSLIARNTIRKTRTGINVEWLYGGIGSADNTFVRNAVSDSGTALFIDAGSDRNVVVGNRIARGGRPAIVLQGASDNLVKGNHACGSSGAIVQLRDANVPAQRNRLGPNTHAPRCT